MLDAREHGAPHEVGNPLVDLNLVEQLATLRKTVDLPAILERPAASVQVAAVGSAAENALQERVLCRRVEPAGPRVAASLARPLPALPPK